MRCLDYLCIERYKDGALVEGGFPGWEIQGIGLTGAEQNFSE